MSGGYRTVPSKGLRARRTGPIRLGMIVAVLERMSSKEKRSAVSAKSVSKSVRKSVRGLAAKATKKTGSALAVVAHRLPARPVKRARAVLKGLPGRTTKFVKSHPLRVLLGASALGLVLAKLKHLV